MVSAKPSRNRRVPLRSSDGHKQRLWCAEFTDLDRPGTCSTLRQVATSCYEASLDSEWKKEEGSYCHEPVNNTFHYVMDRPTRVDILEAMIFQACQIGDRHRYVDSEQPTESPASESKEGLFIYPARATPAVLEEKKGWSREAYHSLVRATHYYRHREPEIVKNSTPGKHVVDSLPEKWYGGRGKKTWGRRHTIVDARELVALFMPALGMTWYDFMTLVKTHVYGDDDKSCPWKTEDAMNILRHEEVIPHEPECAPPHKRIRKVIVHRATRQELERLLNGKSEDSQSEDSQSEDSQSDG